MNDLKSRTEFDSADRRVAAARRLEDKHQGLCLSGGFETSSSSSIFTLGDARGGASGRSPGIVRAAEGRTNSTSHED
jgi:hypothetical protein